MQKLNSEIFNQSGCLKRPSTLEEDYIPDLKSEDAFVLVSSVMNVDPLTVYEDDDALYAKKVMTWYNKKSLPILNGLNQPIGYITKNGILRACISECYYTLRDYNEQILKALTVKEVMEPECFYVSPQMSIRFARQVMQRKQTDFLLVMENEEMVGTLSDIELQKAWLSISN